MSNEIAGEYQIQLGGKVRPFRFSVMEAYRYDKLNQKSGRSVLRLDSSSIDIPMLVDILHLGLQVHDPNLRVETVAAWLTKEPGGLLKMFEFIGTAIANLLGRNEQGEGGSNGDDPLAQSAAGSSDTASSSQSAAG